MFRLKLTRSDTMHMLNLEKTTVADAGLYTARTNYDFTECNVGIRGRKIFILNSFLKEFHQNSPTGSKSDFQNRQ